MTREDREKRQRLMADMYENNDTMTVRQIADLFRVTVEAVGYARKKFKVPPRHPVMVAAKTRKKQ
jgi:hypothetical protein